MEAQLKHDGLFQKIVHHIKDPAGANTSIRFSSDLIKIKTFEPETTLWLNVLLDPERLLKSYQCNESFVRKLDWSLLSRVLQHASNDEQDRVIKLETNSDALIVRSETAETFVDYDIQLPFLPVDIELIDQDWACSITMPAAKLQSILSLYVEGERHVLCGISVHQDGNFLQCDH